MLMDYHTHTLASFDGSESGSAMGCAAIDAGLAQLCLTDHYDLCLPEESQYCPEQSRATAMEARSLLDGRIEILWGVELGQSHHAPEKARDLLTNWDYDFVIGSLHSLRGGADFYELVYSDERYCRQILEAYLLELIEMARLNFFDVLGHLTYPLRYMRQSGFSLDLSPWMEQLQVLFRIIIENGRGIEINTSGLRQPALRETLPPLDILRLYRQCGGEIITTGSDAHTCSDCGAGIRQAQELLREAGFRYVSSFSQRHLKQLPI